MYLVSCDHDLAQNLFVAPLICADASVCELQVIAGGIAWSKREVVHLLLSESTARIRASSTYISEKMFFAFYASLEQFVKRFGMASDAGRPSGQRVPGDRVHTA